MRFARVRVRVAPAAAIVAAACLLLVPLTAQQTPPPAPAPGGATFKTTTRLVVQTVTVKDKEGRSPLTWAEGVFLATHPARSKPSSMALIKKLMNG